MNKVVVVVVCLALASGHVTASAIRIDFNDRMGPIKPVNGVGQPPMIGAPVKFSMMHYLKKAGIPYSRLHDVGGAYGGSRYVDIPNVFPDFDADENDPASYDFAFTDLLMKALDENGIEPFYRLGTTIENFAKVKRYRIDPPADYAKWARIAEHVIRHYTEGWANGFKMKVSYWEIWNEPDNYPDPDDNCMWHGDFKSYIDFYGVVSSHLKKAFPHLMIGGYAGCGFYAAVGAGAVTAANSTPRTEYFLTCAREFLSCVQKEGWPLDFFSFHSYSLPSPALSQVRFARKLLDDYGFTGVELIFNEWLPQPGIGRVGSARQAANIAAELIGLQNGPCDSAMIYDARCGVGAYSPLFNPLTLKPHKAYYVYVAFNELRKLGSALRVEGSADQTGADDGLWFCAAIGQGGATAVLIANTGKECALNLANLGRRVESCRIIDETKDFEAIQMPERIGADSVLLVSFAAADK